MIVVGVDAHKKVHVAVALDEDGRELAEWSGPNSALGWRDLSRWAGLLPGAKLWGIEGAWNYGRGLAQLLVADGETVYEINARWTELSRRTARRPGKTDRLDAHAVARFVRQEAPGLPRVTAEDDTAVLDLLTTERGLSARSASTPPKSMTSRLGTALAKFNAPSAKAESQSVSTSSPCATICIQVPTIEIACPIQITRKSRSASTEMESGMRMRVRSAGGAAAGVVVVAMAWASG